MAEQRSLSMCPSPTLSSVLSRVYASTGSWLQQLHALLLKVSIQLSKQLRVSVTILLLPLLAIVLIACINAISASLVYTYDASVSHAPFTADASPCQALDTFNDPDPSSWCTSLVYAPSTPFTDEVLSTVAAGFPGWRMGVDVVGFPDANSLYLDWARQLGHRDVAIVFTNTSYAYYQGQYLAVGPSQVSYELKFNTSRISNAAQRASPNYNPLTWRIATIQYVLESALANALARNVSRQYPLPGPAPVPVPLPIAQASDLDFQFFPQISSATTQAPPPQNDGTTATLGGPLFVMAAAIASLLLIQLVAAEKQETLLAMMRMSKLKESVYWLSYLLAFAVLALPAAVVATGAGMLAGLQNFVHVAFAIHFLSLWLLLISMCALGMLVAALWTQPRWVNLFSFLCLAACVMATFVFSTNAYYSIQQPSGAVFLTGLLPFFHYGRIWSDIVRHSSVQVVTNATAQALWQAQAVNNSYLAYPPSYLIRLPTAVQQSFAWSDVYAAQIIVTPRSSFQCNTFDTVCCAYWQSVGQGGVCFSSRSTQFSLWMMLLLTLAYTTAAWWLSQVTNDRGGGKPVYFPLRPQYYMETRRHAQRSVEEEDSERQAAVDERDAIARERRLSLQERSIRTLKLSKAYEQRTALKELTMDMQPGRITCILGANGAGKTSLVSVLSGLLRPTFGEAFVCGYSVREDLSHIHALISVCPQDNLLWPQLTVEQHMRLFSALRGIASAETAATVERWLTLVNLWPHRLKRVDELSGGMKRRLCLALALVGEPAVLLLDECSSGLDPMHKVELWAALQQVKRDRVVLLTTHSLAEAEHLADTVALLSDGRLVALGSPAYLRHEYGLGYQLHLLVRPQHVAKVVRRLRRAITNPELLGTEGGAICVGLRRHQLPELVAFMQWASSYRPPPDFERPHHPGGGFSPTAAGGERGSPLIREWSLQQSTLEEVFLRFCHRQQSINSAHLLGSERLADRKDDEKHVGVDGDGDADGERSPSPALSSTSADAPVPAAVVEPTESYRPSEMDQVRAVLLKNWALMRSERRSWVARLLVLLAVALLLIYLVLSARRNDLCPQGYVSIYYPCDAQLFVQLFFTQLSWLLPLDVYIVPDRQQPGFILPLWYSGQDQQFTNASLAYLDSPNPGDTPFASWDLGQGTRGALNVSYNFSFSVQTVYDWAGLMALNGVSSLAEQALLNERLVLSHVNDSTPAQHKAACPNTAGSSSAWLITDNDRAQAPALVAWLFPWTGLQVANSTVSAAGGGSGRFAYRQVLWNLNEPSASVPQLAWNYTQSGYAQCAVSPYLRYLAGGFNAFYNVHALSNALMYTTINTSSSYVSTQLNAGLHPWRQPTAPFISGAILGVGGPDFPGALDPVTLAESVGLMAFILMLLLPWFCDRILYEREAQLFFTQRLAGMRVRSYWLASYLFDVTVAWVWSLCVVLLGYAMGLGLFVTSDVGLWFVLLVCWNHVSVGMAWFLAALFSRRRLAGIALHVVVMLVVVYATMMDLYITGQIAYPKALLVFPPFAFVRALSLVIRDSGGLAALTIGSELSLALLALLLVGTGFMALGWLLHTLQYRSLLSLAEQMPCYRGKRWQARQAESERLAQQRLSVANQSLLSPSSHRAVQEDEAAQASDVHPPEVDEDVQRESDRVQRLARGEGEEALQDVAVLISSLRKRYDKHGPMRLLRRCVGATNEDDDVRRVDAVREVDLAVRYGECLGLLGPNGAGKSTLLSVLSGLLLPSSGRALINGHDVSHELPLVYSSLGICPQHDRLYDELTTRQHLLFYARLKGVPRAQERAAVYLLAKRVQLDGDAFDQRVRELSGGMKRRLSIAISLVGDPLVWLLDEPSTGLSAEARRGVWDIVSQQRERRRCTIITTHMMEEADTLSTRVGIMVKGRMRCLGSVGHLKRRFAHRLSLALTVDDRQALPQDAVADLAQLHLLAGRGQQWVYLQRLLSFVRQEVSDRTELRAVRGQRLLFSLDVDGKENDSDERGEQEAAAQLRSVLPVFERLAALQERLAAEYQVTAWDIAQASLDDVFVETVRRAKEEDGNDHDDIEI